MNTDPSARLRFRGAFVLETPQRTPKSRGVAALGPDEIAATGPCNVGDPGQVTESPFAGAVEVTFAPES